MKTQVSSESVTRLQLSSALLVYENDEDAFVTVHGAKIIAGRPRIGPGVAADRAALFGLAQKLHKAAALSGFLPERLLYLSPRAIAWWRPATPARVWFECEKRADKGLIGTRSAITPHPALVFSVTGGDNWFVHALTENARPGPETELRRAPYMNVWDRARICSGNVKLPDRLDPGVLADYESGFFSSRFTHANAEHLTRYKGGIYALWRDLLDGRHQDFPAGALGPAAGTLAAHIKHLEERKRGDD